MYLYYIENSYSTNIVSLFKKGQIMEDEIDITKWPEYFLVKIRFRDGHTSKILPGSRRKFRLGCPLVVGQPVKRVRIRKSTMGCHAPKAKYDPVTTNIARFEEQEEGTMVETLTSIYMLFPVPA